MVDRVRDIEELFPIWDFDGSGFIEWEELQQVLEGCERLETRKERKAAARLKAKMIENGKVKPLGLKCFVKFVSELFESVSDNDWIHAMEHLKEAVEEAHSLTNKDRHMQLQFSLFRRLDSNKDGIVDFHEISKLLNSLHSRPLSQRKAAAKWQLQLKEKTHSQKDLSLDLKSFHEFMENTFSHQSEEHYQEAIKEMEQEAVRRRSLTTPLPEEVRELE